MVPENIPAMIYYIQGLPKKVRINHHIFSSIKKKIQTGTQILNNVPVCNINAAAVS